MSFIGEAVVTGLLDRVMGKLLDSALNFVADHKQIHQQLKHWQSVLPGIQAVLNDAEEKQIKNEAVKNWLDDLQDLAYDVDDILDEFDYEALRLSLRNTQAQASTTKVRKLKLKLIPTCCSGSNFTPSSFQFNNSMIPKIKEVTARLEGLTKRRSSLGLSEIMSQATNSKEKNSRPLQPTSLVDETVEYVGRHNEKREMLEFLKCSNNSEGVSVLSIIGMGGMGKTTLAQLVYNDVSISESFDHKAWVCVSDNFDAVNITKTILQSITSEPCSYSDLNLLQVKLKEKLSGKTFLLVLDDIWNESCEDWRILRSPFGAGTKIIVTTRLQKVSSNVEPGNTFHLDKLLHDDCLSIFTQHALRARNFDGHPQLKEVGEKIVRRCGGLPLAAKAIGSLLRPVKDHNEWERTCESEIWDLPEDQCSIVPALRLSYHHLPSHLKRCFAYCSIFPKDYEFEEEEMILLWRAEGFLQQNAQRSIKDVGKQYFQDLVSRSFFQISSEDKSRFVMHDLINDLAQLVAGEICSKMEGDKQQMFLNRTRHSSYIASRYDVMKKFEPFNQVYSLRTFLTLRMHQPNYYSSGYLTNFVLVDLLPRLGYLRVLSLCGYQITELPDDVFENLKHLRFLNLSFTKIKWLPDSLCTLYHLETLLLRGCRRLQKLPPKMENLVNLHYLDIRDANSIKKMPFGIGKLRNLERLSDFVIGEGDGHHIGELKNLSDLRGEFCLSGLENVNGEDAGEAKLNEKLGIKRLVLKWTIFFEKYTRKREVEERVLDSLRPPKKVELLVIQNYGGARLCSWIADSSFNKLSSLKLLNCKNCKYIPSIGRLPLLKDLSISGLDEVHKIGVELFGENQSNTFASLETLSFESLPNWEEWDPCEGDEKASRFPCLRMLSIRRCPQLLGRLPTCLPSLQKLEIEECRRLVVSISSFPRLHELSVKVCGDLVDECSSSTGEVTSLQIVTLSEISKFSIPAVRMISRFANSVLWSIHGWKEMESLSQYGFGLVGHHYIRIEDCPQLVSLETEEESSQLDTILPVVECLEIRKCERLKRLPKVLHAYTFLTEMLLEDCPGLVSFGESIFPPALKELKIRECHNLQYLVDEKENNNRSMSSNTPLLLESLEIFKCSSLICLFSRDDICNQLRRLKIMICAKLGNIFLNSKLPIKLKHLQIWNCPMLESIAQDFHETTDLECIRIRGDPNIKSFPRGLDKLNHLQEIEIEDCSSLVSLEESGLPWATTNLRVFSIHNCSNFGALPKCINNFTSLQKLKVSNCWANICFQEEGFPTNLTELTISKAPKIYSSLVEWGFNRLVSLRYLWINGEGCSNVVSFPEQWIGMTLPPSLTQIKIRDFENLEFMCSKGFQHLTSLQVLSIQNCPKLTSLPEKGMLLSLGNLRIRDCPLVEERCSKGKGPEWSKIAHIPHVEIIDDVQDIWMNFFGT